MADPIIIDVDANLSGINAKLDKLDKKLENVGDAGRKSGKQIEDSYSDVANKINKSEAAIKGLNKTINEQEKITAEFRSELARLEEAFKKAGGTGTIQGGRIKKKMIELNRAIKENVNDIKQIKVSKRQTQQNVRQLKTQQKAVKNLGRESKKTTSTIEKLGTRIFTIFAVRQIAMFTAEAVRMSGALKAAQQGFFRVADAGDLERLREATRGTVSDLILMQETVKATNLGVELESFPTLFEFATRRARETGEEVQHLVNSIVEGIGRKSVRRLDNLGISASRLRAQMHGVSLEAASVADVTRAFTEIAQEELDKMGTATETVTDRTLQLTTSMENLQAAIGGLFTSDDLKGISFFAERIDNLKGRVEDLDFVLGSAAVGTVDKWAAAIIFATKSGFEYDLAMAQLKKTAQDANDVLREQARVIEGIGATMQEADGKGDDKGQQGLLNILNEQLKVNKKLLGLAPSQKAVNKILEDRKDIEQEINDILNARMLAGTDADQIGTDEDLVIGAFRDRNSSVEFGSTLTDLEATDLAAIVREQEASANEAYEQALADKFELDQAYIRKREELRDFSEGLEKDRRIATIQAAANLFGALGGLLNDHAEAQKAAAIFSVVLNAYVAIQNALATGGPFPANVVAAAAVGVLAAANVAQIVSTTKPSFYEGTEYLTRDGAPKGKDTIAINAHEGEAIIKSSRNAEHKGLSKAFNGGKVESWAKAKYMVPWIKEYEARQSAEKDRAFTSSIAMGVTNNNKLNDSRIVNELKRGRHATEELVLLSSRRIRNRKFRANG